MDTNLAIHEPTSRADNLIAIFLAGFAILVLVATAPQIGVTWDEPTYIVAAEMYSGWYAQLITQPRSALSPEAISRSWNTSHAHPPVSKVLSGFIWLQASHVLDDLTAHRLGNILMVGALVSLLLPCLPCPVSSFMLISPP